MQRMRNLGERLAFQRGPSWEFRRCKNLGVFGIVKPYGLVDI